MIFPPLANGILLRRYKRFLADIRLADGREITIHCPNTGAMTGCANEGDTVWFSTSDNPKRKYAHTWELTETAAGHFICVNTTRANALVHEALAQKRIDELADYTVILPEQKYGNENSRIDFLLKADGMADCFVEVKSTTLLTENGLGMFPDARTERGQKHLRELCTMIEQGKRAALFFAVLHTGITQFAVARHIDPVYAELFEKATACGVQVLCYRAEVERVNDKPVGMVLSRQILR